MKFEAKSAFLLDRLVDHLVDIGAPSAEVAHEIVDLHARVQAGRTALAQLGEVLPGQKIVVRCARAGERLLPGHVGRGARR